MSEFAIVGAQWHAFWVGGAALAEDLPPFITLFVEAMDDDDNVVGIRTGVALGPVLAAIEVLDSEPEIVSSGWEDVAETSVDVLGPCRVFGTWDSSPAHSVDVTSGVYRLRVHANGRAIDYDAAALEPDEKYLLQLWPGDAGPTRVLRASTRDLAGGSSVEGAYLRRE